MYTERKQIISFYIMVGLQDFSPSEKFPKRITLYFEWEYTREYYSRYSQHA